jgi:hypothetical protein
VIRWLLKFANAFALPGAAAAMLCLYPTLAQTNGDVTDAIPQFEPTIQCPSDKDETIKEVCGFLQGAGAGVLKSRLGDRVYRETWIGGLRGKWGRGSIVLTIHADGGRTLKTPWHRGLYRLKPGELPDFETTLARSDFARLSFYNRYAEVCVDGVATSLEAIVGGRYRLAYFDYCGGVGSRGVADALDQLFVFAAGIDGLHYPFDPAHPTFRG